MLIFYINFLFKDKLDLKCVSSSAVNELLRGIRSQMSNLITGLYMKYCKVYEITDGDNILLGILFSCDLGILYDKCHFYQVALYLVKIDNFF